MRVGFVGWVILCVGCSSLPTPPFKRHTFPSQEAFIGNISRPYQTLGWVRTKVNFASLDPEHEENLLCKNYYNKAVQDLVRLAKEKGGDAVIDVKSVVFLEYGTHEVYTTPECSDDGSEGQILVQGVAVKWISTPSR